MIQDILNFNTMAYINTMYESEIAGPQNTFVYRYISNIVFNVAYIEFRLHGRK